MANPQKRKGDKWERDVANYLTKNSGDAVTRIRAGWTDDRGDLDGLPYFAVECKDQARWCIPAWFREAEREAAAWDEPRHPLLVVKRPQLPVDDALAITTLDALTSVLAEMLLWKETY
jgi:hypothetical protein